MNLLLAKKDILLINTKLASIIGLNDAVVLQQLSYWLEETTSGVEHDGMRWIYNTHEQWQAQFPFWSVDTVKRSFTSLHKKELIFVKQLAASTRNQTNYYTINQAAVDALHQGILPSSIRAACTDPKGQVAPMQRVKLPCSSNKTETTTETTAGEERAKALGIPPSLFSDYLQIREAKKAGPLTNTAIEGLKDDAKLAGITVKQAITACVKHSWASFVPAWYAERSGAAPSAPAAPAKGKAQPGEQNYVPPVSGVWHESLSGVASKAAEMDLKPRDEVMETAPAFKARVMAEVRKVGTA